jgi:hypothetical protein
VRLAILCQEEPVFLGPFLQRVLAMRPASVAAVFLAGRRGAGERRGSLRELLRSLHTLWLILEPAGFLRAAALRLCSRVLGRLDPRSVAGRARKLGIPAYRVGDPNGPEFRELLARLAPDAVLNQSELLLRREVLGVPRLGFVNRHASLLPEFRGRLASFRAHAAEPPRWGLTVHIVDEGIDTGPAVLREEFRDFEPAWSYPRCMAEICARAPEVFWRAMDLLASPGFKPEPQPPGGAPPRGFPSLAEAREYRRTLARRRAARG